VILRIVWGLGQLPIIASASLVFISVIAGISICGIASEYLDSPDHPGIVWDEIAGMMLTMVFIPLNWSTLIAGFILFRLFDILKPWPIRYLDRHVHGGLGIMLDDVVAAIFSGILLQILLPYLPV